MQQQHHPLLSASLGTQREIVSFHFGTDSHQRVYIQAALHGDELPGMAVAWYLKHKLLALESAGQLKAKITLVPVANPLALSQHWHGTQLGRFHTQTGQDFNRRFPALGETLAAELADVLTQSEYENKRIIREAIDRHYRDRIAKNELDSQRYTLMRMASQADLMIDLHCDWDALPHLYTTPHAWQEIEPLARWLGSEVQLLAQISGGEPFDEACCEPWVTLAEKFSGKFPMPRGLLPVTLELRGVADVAPEQAEKDADAIINALIEGGYIEGDVGESPALLNPATELAGCEYIHAPHSGLLLNHRALGEWIKAGEVVAEIVDPITDQVTPLIAQYGGILYARNLMKFVTTGMLAVRLAGENAGRSGALLVE
ncbi:succinylglutamate desuccinylase/aspartoacylase family protein [Candidatus Pantoea multigeneris]|uniref:Succinylglutamate desuccinylase/aspartoacylase family protein n=1 Tax=Candidatus Pantoea multigeneris TaxID=2608357 RepID=A0ABX0RKE6_9GAMM|nr:succinylglutamate desuccinylase/aspartoacylase family protein [Pantoea multigeneris]NIF24618.1 succinylglutamate desuccinylase/aspartoacylase family protein [Pantoea multigeneris]